MRSRWPASRSRGAVAEHDELADALGAAAAGFGGHQGGELVGGGEAAQVAGGVGVAHRPAVLVGGGLGKQADQFGLAGAGSPVGALAGPVGDRGRHHGHPGAVDGDVQLVRRRVLAADAGSTATLPRVTAADSAVSRSATAAPSVSAERSIRLADNRIPASSASRSAAAANGCAAAARAVIERRPGDSDAPATPRSSSRGAIPCPHSAQ